MKIGHSITDKHKVVVVKERGDKRVLSDFDFWAQVVNALSHMGVEVMKTTAAEDGICRPDRDRMYVRDWGRSYRIYYAGPGTVADQYLKKRYATLHMEDLSYTGEPPVIGDRLLTPVYYEHEREIGQGV